MPARKQCWENLGVRSLRRETWTSCNRTFGRDCNNMADGMGPSPYIMGMEPRSPWKWLKRHTSELQSHHDLVCRLLLEKKKKKKINENKEKTISGEYR